MRRALAGAINSSSLALRLSAVFGFQLSDPGLSADPSRTLRAALPGAFLLIIRIVHYPPSVTLHFPPFSYFLSYLVSLPHALRASRLTFAARDLGHTLETRIAPHAGGTHAIQSLVYANTKPELKPGLPIGTRRSLVRHERARVHA